MDINSINQLPQLVDTGMSPPSPVADRETASQDPPALAADRVTISEAAEIKLKIADGTIGPNSDEAKKVEAQESSNAVTLEVQAAEQEEQVVKTETVEKSENGEAVEVEKDSDLHGERTVAALKKRDRQVRMRETTRAVTGGHWVGSRSSFEFVTGPDGKDYATATKDRPDMNPVPGDTEATVQKMQQVRRAALAAPDPSSPDKAIAERASVEDVVVHEEQQVEQRRAVAGNDIAVGVDAAIPTRDAMPAAPFEDTSDESMEQDETHSTGPVGAVDGPTPNRHGSQPLYPLVSSLKTYRRTVDSLDVKSETRPSNLDDEVVG